MRIWTQETLLGGSTGLVPLTKLWFLRGLTENFSCFKRFQQVPKRPLTNRRKLRIPTGQIEGVRGDIGSRRACQRHDIFGRDALCCQGIGDFLGKVRGEIGFFEPRLVVLILALR